MSINDGKMDPKVFVNCVGFREFFFNDKPSLMSDK